ncbi:MAG: hypothetical protein R2832_19030 [Rhodothermales bacterium]
MPHRSHRIPIRAAIVAAILAAALPARAGAQGFLSFNGRNHPELKWMVAETEHFSIAYPAHLAGIEDRAAPIAEATYAALSNNLGVSFDRKIRIYLSDEDENTNGFAVPVGSGYTNIWVNVNDAAVYWTGPTKWLRKVIAHELTHIFHYRAIRSTMHPFDFAVSDPLPSFWTEGLAQYETEKWDAYRGDQILRTAVLDDQLSYSDGRSIRNGSLKYAVGHSQVRFFADQFGDSTLAKLLSWRKFAPLRIAKYHSFSSAFKATTGESYREFYDDWRRTVNIRYNTLAGFMENADSLGTDPLAISGQYLDDLAFSPGGSQYAALTLESIDRPVRRIVVRPAPASLKARADSSAGADNNPNPRDMPAGMHQSAGSADERTSSNGHSADQSSGAVDVNATTGEQGNSETSDDTANDTGTDVEVLAEGAIRAPLAWSPDGARITYVRNVRGANGSLVNDIFLADVKRGHVTRVTTDRRAFSPSFTADGAHLVYVASDGGTSNVFIRDLVSGNERAVTAYSGDVQIGVLRVHPTKPIVAFSLFAADGTRQIVAADLETGAQSPLTDGEYDDREPVWSGDGTTLYFNSLRDGVPNVFSCRFSVDGTSADSLGASCTNYRRVTNLVTGASATDWIAGRLVLRVSATKTRDSAYLVRADRKPYTATPKLNTEFTEWTTHHPPDSIPRYIPPDPSLITARGDYRAIRNLTHVASVVLPYVTTARYGIGGLTIWTEPLGKHTVYAALGVDARDPLHESGFQAGYLNNQFRPSITTEVRLLPDSPRPYGRDLLLERLAQVTVHPVWSLNTIKPYQSRTIGVKFGFIRVEPRTDQDIEGITEGLPVPETGSQYSVRLSYTWKKQRPWVNNLVHPLDGTGFRVRATAAAQGVHEGQRYVRMDVGAYTVLPSLGRQRLFVYGRVQAQKGVSLAQDFLGLSRYDILQVSAPSFISFQSSNSERVRGYRSFVLGKLIGFGSVEYRVPLTPSLQTELLGLIGLGSTAAALFVDGAIVSPEPNLDVVTKRLGAGLEIKNEITFGGTLSVMHAIGIAQQAGSIGTGDNWEVYYRVRTVLPF